MAEQLPPAPWDIVTHQGCFEVRASTGEHIYIYFEDEVARRAALRRFSREQAKRIALMIAKLAEPTTLESNEPSKI
jgi:hypothetical protein